MYDIDEILFNVISIVFDEQGSYASCKVESIKKKVAY